MNASPDLDTSRATARHELNFLLVLGDRNLLRRIVLLVTALLHEVLGLDDDHASDILRVRLVFFFRARLWYLVDLEVGEMLLLHAR